MKTEKIKEDERLMKCLVYIREKVYKDISRETREEIKKHTRNMTEDQKEVIDYFLEPGLYFNFYLGIY